MADFHNTFSQSPHQPHWGGNVHPPHQSPGIGPIGELSADNTIIPHPPTPTYLSLASTYVDNVHPPRQSPGTGPIGELSADNTIIPHPPTPTSQYVDNVHPPRQSPGTGPVGELSADNMIIRHPPTTTYPSLASTYIQNVHPPHQSPGTGPIGELSADNTIIPHSPTPTYPSLASTYIRHDGMKSPGLSSVVDTEYEKEAVPDQFYTTPTSTDPRETETKKNSICGIRRPQFLLVLIAATCIAIAVGTALGVTLGRKKSRSQPSAPVVNGSGNSSMSAPGPVTPSYYSTTGAFNGTGLALAEESFEIGGHGATNMYFQHHTGQLRVIELAADGSWKGGSPAEVVAFNAKNGTPISVVSYALDQKAAWHIFYIDTNNQVAERIQDNLTNIWSDGPIGKLGLNAVDDPNVALQACWYGSYYGNVTYYNNSTSNQTDQTVGIHLWYGNTGSSIQEVSWLVGAEEWTTEYLFEGFNGHGGIGCYSWGYGSVTYVMMVNLYSQVEIWWKDLNTTQTSTSAHPINSWQNSSLSIPTVQQNTSLGYTDFFFMQHADLGIGGYNVRWAAENTSLITTDTFSISGGKGLPGTHLTCTALHDSSGTDSVLVFFQTHGSDVTEWRRDLSVGEWTMLEIPIPAS